MYTALRATSNTLSRFVQQRLENDPILAAFFDAGSGGSMRVTLNTPKEMSGDQVEGLSVWLYRVARDEDALNALPLRVAPNLLRLPPLPLRLHYLMTPITRQNPDTEQVILGKVLQTFYDHPLLRGADLQDELSGTEVELSVRLESLSLEEITRVWESLEGSYQLSVSYEVGVVPIESGLEPEQVTPVRAVLPEYGLIVAPDGTP